MTKRNPFFKPWSFSQKCSPHGSQDILWERAWHEQDSAKGQGAFHCFVQENGQCLVSAGQNSKTKVLLKANIFQQIFVDSCADIIFEFKNTFWSVDNLQQCAKSPQSRKWLRLTVCPIEVNETPDDKLVTVVSSPNQTTEPADKTCSARGVRSTRYRLIQQIWLRDNSHCRSAVKSGVQ